MKLVFLGTRGYIEPRTERHYRHSTTLVQYRGRGIALDCGEDWLGLVAGWRVAKQPDAEWPVAAMFCCVDLGCMMEKQGRQCL